jgi:hypothetical protein
VFSSARYTKKKINLDKYNFAILNVFILQNHKKVKYKPQQIGKIYGQQGVIPEYKNTIKINKRS